MNPLEDRIRYKFRNPLLLAEALTHPSLRHETQRYHFDNQRLEFLGDAVLQLVITEHLFGHFKDEAEGKLTKLRSRLVSREALTVHAAALDLGRYLMMGRGEEASGGRERNSTLADAFEALRGRAFRVPKPFPQRPAAAARALEARRRRRGRGARRVGRAAVRDAVFPARIEGEERAALVARARPRP